MVGGVTAALGCCKSPGSILVQQQKQHQQKQQPVKPQPSDDSSRRHGVCVL
jgi:hypothetical protein